MNTVDPCPAQVGQGFEVYISPQKLSLKSPHRAGGRSLSFDGLAANNPPHAGLRPRRSASFKSSYPPRRPNTD